MRWGEGCQEEGLKNNSLSRFGVVFWLSPELCRPHRRRLVHSPPHRVTMPPASQMRDQAVGGCIGPERVDIERFLVRLAVLCGSQLGWWCVGGRVGGVVWGGARRRVAGYPGTSARPARGLDAKLDAPSVRGRLLTATPSTRSGVGTASLQARGRSRSGWTAWLSQGGCLPPNPRSRIDLMPRFAHDLQDGVPSPSAAHHRHHAPPPRSLPAVHYPDVVEVPMRAALWRGTLTGWRG